MCRQKVIKNPPSYLLFFLLLLNTVAFSAQNVVESGSQSAGFSFATNSSSAGSAVPVLHYQQNIQMLSTVGDMPSISIYGDGRVHVHNPVYMKKAGDYEMLLSKAELNNLIQSFSANGMMDFDENKVRGSIQAKKQALAKQGQFYDVSDSVDTVIDIKLDSYQRNNRSAKVSNFNKTFKWKNIEHDAHRHKNESALVKANSSVSQLRGLMKDSRLKKAVQQGGQQ